MFYRTLLWGMWLRILLPPGISAEGESPPKEVIGILGGSATFLLENPSPFDAVLWFKNEKQVAILKLLVGSCQPELLGAYEGREVTVSTDCSSLTVGGLREEDSAGYKAEPQKNFKILASQTFTLKVYKRLSETDLSVSCAKDIRKGRNETLQLNCSAGKWEDGVAFSWIAYNHSGQDYSSGKSRVFFGNLQDDWNVTCMAENPVGNASKTVSLKQACSAGEQTTGRSPTAADPETGDTSSSGGWIILGVVLTLLVLAVLAVLVWRCRRKKTAAERKLNPSSSHSGPKTVVGKSPYGEIQNVPEDVERQRRQQRRGPKAQKKKPMTIYADVQHPDKIPLQTDDEKMRREKRRAAEKSEKTIYSEISGPKEPTENLKTIYDTVNHSRPPEHYNNIL